MESTLDSPVARSSRSIFCQEQVSRRKGVRWRRRIRGGRYTGHREKRREEQQPHQQQQQRRRQGQSAGVGKMANLTNKLSRKLVGNKLEAGFVAQVYSSGES